MEPQVAQELLGKVMQVELEFLPRHRITLAGVVVLVLLGWQGLLLLAVAAEQEFVQLLPAF
jgi:hypothetical protein